MEPFDGRPFLVEPIEHFRVDRERCLDALHVRDLRAFAGELAALGAIQLAERFGCRISVGFGPRSDWLKESATHDFVALVAAGWLPWLSEA